MNIEQEFRDSVEAFLAHQELSPTRFGLLAVNDPDFVRAVRNGRSVTLRKYDSVKSFMKEYAKRRKNKSVTKTPASDK